MKETFKKADTYMQHNCTDLQFIFSKVKKLNELNQAFSTYLEAAIRKHCCIANVHDNRLIVLVTNGSIATQMRYQTAELLRQMKQNHLFMTIKDIEWKVRPDIGKITLPQDDGKQSKMRPLSVDTAQIVKDSAQSLKDPALKAIMERIAQHTGFKKK